MSIFENKYGTITTLPAIKVSSSHHRDITKNDLSEDQIVVYTALEKWVKSKNGSKVVTFGGYAGTGKTTLISLLADSLDMSIAFCAYSGKASNVLRQKLSQAGVDMSENFCGTIHSLIYIPISDPKTGQIIRWENKDDLDDYDLIIVDEASMIDQELFEDLKSYGIKILAVGDHGQLPPIAGNFNLMGNPDLKLEKIHRQAEHNPIIKLSQQIRETGEYKKFPQSEHVKWLPYNKLNNTVTKFADDYNMNKGILCYTNRSRVKLNNIVRDHLDLPTNVSVNDIILCLKNVSFEGMCLYNGSRAVVKSIKEYDTHRYTMKLLFEEDRIEFDGQVSKIQFGQEKTFNSFEDGIPHKLHASSWVDFGMLCDYSYSFTVHKSQGSQYIDVIGLVERPRMIDEDTFRRWLYTLCTRASNSLTLVG